MKRRILITGGAGFIGTNSVLHFLDKGWDVTILDNLSRRGVDLNLKRLESSHPRKFSFIKADVRYDQDVLDREAAAHDAVLLLAMRARGPGNRSSNVMRRRNMLRNGLAAQG